MDLLIKKRKTWLTLFAINEIITIFAQLREPFFLDTVNMSWHKKHPQLKSEFKSK